MNTDFDLYAYENIDDMYGYVGFISEDGKFYRVRRFLHFEEGTHPKWADAFTHHKNSFVYLLTELHFMAIVESWDKTTISYLSNYYDDKLNRNEFSERQYKTFKLLKLSYEQGERYAR